MGMSISPTVQAAANVVQAQTTDAVGIAVLKKAIDADASAALSLLAALPQPAPPLASQGTLGTRLNTFA